MSELRLRLKSHQQGIARERRHAAIHEAGHFVVATSLGYELKKYYIERTFREYIGQVEILNCDAPQHLRLIGVAGGVAECCWRNWGLVEAYALLSDSDWELTGCLPGEPDNACIKAFEKVWSQLSRGGQLWPKLIVVARMLILDARREEEFNRWLNDVKSRDVLTSHIQRDELCDD